ncbi:MAG: helix-turn-helix transcriptional regulator [Caulobacter sp.]|nr:helix-turn-helix transcriptional regulator [Caulobacter sp.]
MMDFESREKVTSARPLISVAEALVRQPREPIVTSRERAWGSVAVDVHRSCAGVAERVPALDHHMIGYCRSGGGRLIQGRAGKVHSSMLSAGSSLLMPAGYDATWEGDAPASVRIRVAPSLVTLAGEQIGRRGTAQIEIRNVFQARDAMIERIAMTFLAELDRKPHPAQRLIVEGLSCAIVAHLLRHYNAFEDVELAAPPSLGPSDVAKITQYIEDNIEESIGLSDLAGLVNVSRFHFARLFKQSMGVTTRAFVEQRRISRAQSLILESDLPLAEVALITGFSDQSHFTRRFHRHAGCTPAVFAREQGRRRSTRRAG